jgi:sulfite reductase (NADPH) flavoprotein alpha-component
MEPDKVTTPISSSLPFGHHLPLSCIGGPTYVTAQTLAQQVAYALSDRLWTYSPETFDLDLAVEQWFKIHTKNFHGYPTKPERMQIRHGAASIALGYIFSKDFELKKRYIPQSILASTAALLCLREALDQLSLLYAVASPFVAHIAAVDYVGSSTPALVTDYVSTMTLAEELGFGLVSSFSTYEVQHMSLYATLLANIMPAIHTYDGVSVGRETTRVIDVLDKSRLGNLYQLLSEELIKSKSSKRTIDLDTHAARLLTALNGELGTTYGLFEYLGHPAARSVLVVFGTVESSLASQVALALEKDGVKVGVLNVRVYRPFAEEEFLRELPKSVEKVGVLGQVHDTPSVSDDSVRSNLFEDVIAAVSFSNKWPRAPTVIDLKYPRERVWSPSSILDVFQSLISKRGEWRDEQAGGSPDYSLLQAFEGSGVQQYVFWDIDDSLSAEASIILGQALSKDSSNNVTIRTSHDNMLQGGISRTDIRQSKKTIEAAYSVQAADLAFVGSEKVLRSIDVSSGLKTGGKIIIRLPGVKDDELEKKLPLMFQKALALKEAELYILDPGAINAVANDPSLETVLVQVAFLRLELPALEPVIIQKIGSMGGNLEMLEKISQELNSGLRKIQIPQTWKTIELEESVHIPLETRINSFSRFEQSETIAPTVLKDWRIAAKGLAFKEAFGTKSSLRPDVSAKTYTVHVSANRRLTPPTYERNIFHIEFDLGNSGLKYEIGEALGIHAENDEFEVQEFIKFYGLDPEEIVEVQNREDPNVFENRTVYQALMQNVDIFGRPPKRFYEALAEFAADPNEKKELLTLGGPEGAVEFKRRAEVDTVTYADILLDFPSAHPSFHDVVRIVAPMKRREYSIASCQKVTPTTVALMIVVVGWVDPKGRDRFGQATRFLNKLKPGRAVTVSVKPSVMKLPPHSTQPLIMAGLGTGLAPFRAFVQHRALEKAQGKQIGAVLLYMGSRHQREEYCYGEEWEAYRDAGVITLLGRAFSRDQPQKIYIQDRMRETLNDIIQAYLKEDGAFYLCGPTWPVPDVTNVLEDAIAQEAKMTGKRMDPKREIERLKDQARYVLEVY